MSGEGSHYNWKRKKEICHFVIHEKGLAQLEIWFEIFFSKIPRPKGLDLLLPHFDK